MNVDSIIVLLPDSIFELQNLFFSSYFCVIGKLYTMGFSLRTLRKIIKIMNKKIGCVQSCCVWTVEFIRLQLIKWDHS